jgi:prephenate dehydratase
MEILDQFASRGVNLSRIESRPTGQYLGHYFFSIDADGHAGEARVADALAGLHRISPGTRFLGSYARADKQETPVPAHTSDAAFAAAQSWVESILAAESFAGESGSGASPTA